jgi:UDP-N-acetylmuramate dehydrogenase
MTTAFSQFFLERVKRPLREGVMLRDYSHFRIGGPADYFLEAKTVSELRTAIQSAREYSFPYYLVGGGHNLLFDDEGFRGLIIKNEVCGIKQKEKKGGIETLSGTPLASFVQFMMDQGLEGLEFMAGIPGTVGGAVFGNAGAFGQSVGNYLKRALLLQETGEEVEVKRDYFEFSYRHSFLKKKHDILLSAVFALEPGDKKKIRDRIEGNLKKRKEKHPPWETACAGSYFKNPVLPDGTKVPAGYLLEQVGAKSARIGDAAVFSGHSNFLINLGRARAQDVLLLAQELKEKVKGKFGVELEEEVIYVPASSSMP